MHEAIEMIIDKLWDWIVELVPKKDENDFAGLMILALSMVMVLVIIVSSIEGVVMGLTPGFILAIMISVVTMAVYNLRAGLGLTFLMVLSIIGLLGIVNLFNDSSQAQSWGMIIGLLILVLVWAEAYYWLDDKKREKRQSRFWYTCERKIIYLIESAVVVGLVFGWVYLIVRSGPKLARIVGDAVREYGLIVVHYVALVILIGAIVAVYLLINSLKYKNAKPRRRNKPRKKCERAR